MRDEALRAHPPERLKATAMGTGHGASPASMSAGPSPTSSCRRRGATVRLAKTPTTIDNQAYGVVAALAAARCGPAAGDRAWHDDDDQRRPRAQGGQGRADHHARDSATSLELGRRTRPQALRPHRHVRAADAARAAARGPRAHGRGGRGRQRRSTRRRWRAAAHALIAEGCEVAGHPFPAHLRQPGARAPRRRNRRATCGPTPTSPPGTAAVGGPRIRARHHRARQRRGAADPHALRRAPAQRTAKPGLHPRPPGHAGQWRHDVLRHRLRARGNTVMSGPASGVIAAAHCIGRAPATQPDHLRHGRHLDRRRADPDGVPTVSELELEYAMPIHVPMVDVHTIGAGGGSIAAINAAGMLQVGPESAGADAGPDLLRPRRHANRPSPTPIWCSAGSIRSNCSRGAGRCRRRGARDQSSSDRHAARPRRRSQRRRRSCASPTTRWPARSAWFRWRAATIRATSRCSPSAAPARCMPRRWRASSAFRSCSSRRARASPMRSAASSPTCATISSTPSTSRCEVLDVGRVEAILEAQIAEGRAMIAARGRRRREASRMLHLADMQFQGQTHILRVPIGSTAITVARAARAFEAAYCERFGVELPEIRASAGQSAHRGDRRAHAGR